MLIKLGSSFVLVFFWKSLSCMSVCIEFRSYVSTVLWAVFNWWYSICPLWRLWDEREKEGSFKTLCGEGRMRCWIELKGRDDRSALLCAARDSLPSLVPVPLSSGTTVWIRFFFKWVTLSCSSQIEVQGLILISDPSTGTWVKDSSIKLRWKKEK